MMTSQPLITRFAPTPSGFLHFGNVYSFLITWLIAKKGHGKIVLRIDDLDKERKREQYITNVFDTLDWLQLDYDIGPSSVHDFNANYSQFKRMDMYWEAFKTLQESNTVFGCECSRKEILADAADGIYSGKCKTKALGYTSQLAARLDTANVHSIVFTDWIKGKIEMSQNSTTKDFVVWTKQNRPSYQLASIVDDQFYQVNCIVRGEDLLSSTAAQLLLAKKLEGNRFSESRFYHHGMMLAADQSKLSKSQQAPAVFDQFKNAADVLIYFGKSLGLEPDQCNSLDNLLSNFEINLLNND